MARGKRVGRSTRFGTRYGVAPRRRVLEIEAEARKKHPCPSCGEGAVERSSIGVWRCGRCGYTFTGGAYTPQTKVGETASRGVRLPAT